MIKTPVIDMIKSYSSSNINYLRTAGAMFEEENFSGDGLLVDFSPTKFSF